MELQTVLTAIEQVRANLAAWGITNQVLVITGLVAFAFFILSLRELSVWFFKVQHLRDEVRALRDQTAELQKTVADLRLDLAGGNIRSSETAAADAAPENDTEPEPVKKSLFRLDH